MRLLSHAYRLVACLTVWACGAAEDGSSQASQSARHARPEADENGVRVRSGTREVGSDTVSDCIETPQAVSIEEARERALPIDEHLAWFAQTHEASLHYGLPSCAPGPQPSSDTRLAISIRPLQTYAVSVERNPINFGDEPLGEEGLMLCGTDYLSYDAVVTVETGDGALAGVFYAPASGREQVAFAVATDVRNFEGTLELALDPDRTHVALLSLNASIGAEGLRGNLFTSVTYVDVEPWRADVGGFAFFPARNDPDDPICSTLDAVTQPATGLERFTLDFYAGSDSPVTLPLRLEALAFDGASADVEVVVGGEAQQVTSVSGSRELELGRFELGTELEVAVQNRTATGRVRVALLNNDCVVATVDCNGAECSRDEALVALVDCR